MRILVNNEWFEPVSSESQYEFNYEALLLSQANVLFPAYFTVPFKLDVHSPFGTKRPDLALVDMACRYWWVVEVELAHHSLHDHVLPQVQVFASGEYGETHAKHLAESLPEIQQSTVLDMVKGTQPRVLVVVNRNCPNWVQPLRGYNANLSVVEVFRSDRNQHVLRVNGDDPGAWEKTLISRCRLDPLMPSLLQIDSPAALGLEAGGRTSIATLDGLTEWQRIDSQDQVWLNPLGRNPLTATLQYEILQDDDGKLFFREVKKGE